MKHFVLVLLTGCTSAPVPDVGIHSVGLTPRQHELVLEALYGWDALGATARFDIAASTDILSCVGDAAGCAESDRSMIAIDARLDDLLFLEVARHELGHVLLHTKHHLAPGAHGVMQAVDPAPEVTADDLALACRLVGLGC